MKRCKPYLHVIFCLVTFSGLAQTSDKIDLIKLDQQNGIHTYNRHSGILKATEPVIHLDEQPGEGVAWLTDRSFVNGTIELDIKGKNVYQKSFLGVAFHGVDNLTYDAVYFRPFNFKTDDATRKLHAVQYISMPVYNWQVLREKFPNQYEQPVSNVPDADNWFHAKIVVKDVTISVYVNHNTKADLQVQQLVKLNGSKIGLWVGDGSGGEWKNLVITKVE